MKNIIQEKFRPTTAITWCDSVNCTPIDDLRNWQEIQADQYGYYSEVIIFDYDTVGCYLYNSNQFRDFSKGMDHTIKLSELLSTMLWGYAPLIIHSNCIGDGKVKLDLNDNQLIENRYRPVYEVEAHVTI